MIWQNQLLHISEGLVWGLREANWGQRQEKVKERKWTTARVELVPECPLGQVKTRPADCVRVGITVDPPSMC